jgi:hypothetical protein
MQTAQSQEQEQERRVWFLAVNLLERIRPLVEGAVTEATFGDAAGSECDRPQAFGHLGSEFCGWTYHR